MTEKNEKLLKITDKIRDLDNSLKNCRIRSVLLDTQRFSSEVEIVSDKSVDEALCPRITEIIRGYMPERFSAVSVKVAKLVCDPELVARSIADFIDSEFISISGCFSGDDIAVTVGDVCSFVISAHDDVCRFMEDNDVVSSICVFLENTYCSTFVGRIKNIGKSKINTEILKDKVNESDLEVINPRTFAVKDVVRLWGDEIDPIAIYSADYLMASGNVSFAGEITSVNQKETRTGKPFYIIELDDKTGGRISGKIFMTKEKEKKMEKLQVGTRVITRGDLSEFGGRLGYRIDSVSFCELPENFVPEDRPSKRVPSEYRLVFPEPLVEISQSFLFAETRSVPECLVGRECVVVDIETTGVSFVGGDKITEIGAVKISDGRITEKFQTLVNPEKPISAEITSLTGIDDSMVKDAPTFSEVLPDFYKFCDGCIFVAHNIEFDYKFIKYLARDSGYVFNNPGIDTLAMSKELLPRLKNHKLNTVCGYFNIEFLHHRALSDAHATAKLFLELVFMKKSLPIGG